MPTHTIHIQLYLKSLFLSQNFIFEKPIFEVIPGSVINNRTQKIPIFLG